jgi:leader peptidase (prepilin peptidase) / N-methyltransferase
MTLLPAWYWPLVAGVFGAVFASFGAVLIERLPDRLPLGGRSRCVCGRVLSVYENLPVFGWLLLRGRSRCCGARIPVWYLLAEALGATLWVAVVVVFGPAALPLLAVFSVAACTTVGLRRRTAR